MLCECVAERLRLSHLRAEVLHLWLRDADLCSQTRQIQLGAPTQVSGRLAKACFRLIHKHWDGAPIRSIGVQVSQLSFEKDAYQLSIFSQKEQKNAELDVVSMICAIALGIGALPRRHFTGYAAKNRSSWRKIPCIPLPFERGFCKKWLNICL